MFQTILWMHRLHRHHLPAGICILYTPIHSKQHHTAPFHAAKTTWTSMGKLCAAVQDLELEQLAVVPAGGPAGTFWPGLLGMAGGHRFSSKFTHVCITWVPNNYPLFVNLPKWCLNLYLTYHLIELILGARVDLPKLLNLTRTKHNPNIPWTIPS